ncbi:MAG: M48 family metallopeptidase [Planctomycetota bacterium]|jgi:predicted Zn-dependent protease
MKDWIRQVFVLCVLMVFLAGCTTVPITGRSQFNTVPDSLINSMALQEYNTFLKSPENKLSTDPEKTAMVQRVGDRIADAVERYMNENGHADLIADYQWEFNLIDSDQKNAWAMPGGKVERMTQGLTITLGGVALDKALEDEPSATRNIFLTSYGLGATIGVMLPYSRTHETEADRLGLIFMAMAGYAPEEAVGFWQRMAQSKDGSAPPEFLSTHPADETRIRNIKADLYEARRYYRPYKPAIE